MPSEENQFHINADSAGGGSLPNASAEFAPAAADFRTVPNGSERFGKVPHSAEAFGTLPNSSETFRTTPSVRRENCTLTVREVARLFEAASVARSERSITNWCQPNRQGIARLEAYYDPNERRYFITPQSVEAVIAEEKAKAAKANAEPLPHVAEEFRTPTQNGSEAFRTAPNSTEAGRSKSSDPDLAVELAELKKENFDLKITNRAKDQFIARLEVERDRTLTQLIESSRHIGQLETKLQALEAPKSARRLDARSEAGMESSTEEETIVT